MHWFKLSGKLGRKDFLVRVIVIAISFWLLFFLSSPLLLTAFDAHGYFIIRAAFSTLAVIVCLPLIAQRLRNISWTIQLVWLFAAAAVLSLPNVTLFALYALDEHFISAVLVVPILVINAAAFGLFLVLLFKRGSGDLSTQP